MSKRQMKLGLFLLPTGQHVAAWRLPETVADMHVNVDYYAELARELEAAKFDLLFLADGDGIHGGWPIEALSHTANRVVAQFEPLTLLSALSQTTSKIGLVATASTTYYDPYRVARLFGSVDLMSGGRAGWNVVTTANTDSSENFGYVETLPAEARYARAEEFVDVVTGLWRSWEDDAFPRNKQTGAFFDPAKMHILNHKGQHFTVKGPLIVPRSAQGHPVIVQAGSSGPGKNLAARTAEIVFTAQPDKGKAQAFYQEIKAAAEGFGRSADDVKIMPGMGVTVAETEAEAKAKIEELESLIDPVVGLTHLSSFLGFDVTGYPVDGPLPDIPEASAKIIQSRQKLFIDMAREENLTLRQIYIRASVSKGHLNVVGSPTQVADLMEEWFLDGAADGFNVMPSAMSGGIVNFTRLVVPELQRRGLFRKDYEGATLRENLGLKRPL
jgi:N-acetyl-S-(2-succino)cysteine monooxygenase